MCSTSLHDRYALNLRCVHNHTLQLHNERERKIPHWGACHAGEHATLRNMPRWGACHAGEHADRSPWIAYPFNALQMRRSFSPCRKHTTTSPPQRFGIDTQPFFLYNTCRFWTLHLSSTTLPDHPQLERSAVHINIAAHAFAQRFKPHLDPNRTGSQATLITSRTPPSPAYKHRSYRIAIALDRQ